MNFKHGNLPIKHIVTAIAFFSVIAMLAGKVNAIPPASSDIVIPSKVTNISQAQEKPNLKLLARVLNTFFQNERYLIESETLGSAKGDSLNSTLQFQSKSLVESGGKFRFEITFIQPGEKTKVYNLIIFDGQQVWIYKPQSQEYAITSYAAFKQHPVISLSSLLFIAVHENRRKLVAQSDSSGEITLYLRQIVNKLALANDSELKEEKRTIDGNELSIYTYTVNSLNYVVSGFIDPATVTLKQIQISSNSEGKNFVITEKNLQITADPPINVQTFKFSPPPGAKQVNFLSILPFEE